MRVLITTYFLKDHTGAELYARDLARGLRRRGHAVAIFARTMGDLARQMQAEGFEVVDDLSRLSAQPDIIHGHHQPCLVAALVHFPRTPALFVVHDAEWPLDEPFVFPRVRRHIAVDARCLRRITANPGLPASERGVILNFVDLDRFRPRPPLPPTPRKALVFSNYARTPDDLTALRGVCEAQGIQLDFAGMAAGRVAMRPEDLLGEYDIVFAKARAAIEAMAVGCAVILCDFAGFGGMVASARFDHLRAWNFGAGVLTGDVTTQAVTAELARYDPADAEAVSRRIRAEASLDQAVDQWLALYREILAEAVPVDTATDRRRLALAHWRWRLVHVAASVARRAEHLRERRSIGGLLYRLARKAWRGGSGG